MDLSRYAELFLTESQEHLLAVNDALLELERSGQSAEAVDRFFRAVHTIKGMSATMGYDAVARLTHEMESLLALVRDGTRHLDGELLDRLFQATDALEGAVVQCAAGGAETVDLTSEIAAIASARSFDGGPVEGERRRRPETGSQRAVAAPANSVAVAIELSSDTPLPGVRALLILERLRSKGEILKSHPGKDALQDEAFDGRFVVYLRTGADHASLRELVLAAGDVVSVSVADGGVPSAADHGSHRSTSPDARGESGSINGPPAGKDRRGVKHVRVEQRRLDTLMNLAGELVINRGRLARRVEELGDAELVEILAALSRQVSDLHAEVMASRMVPVWQVFDRFPRLVRDAAKSLGKEVELVMEGREIELDRSLLEEIGDPIVHLLRNAVDHGLELPGDRRAAGKGESGRLVLSAIRDRETVLIRVSDDGRGIDRRRIAAKARAMGVAVPADDEITDEALFGLISMSGLSTAEQITDISGRGVGVDAVITKVRNLGGSVELDSTAGVGTTVTIRLPLTLAIVRVLLADVGGETYAFPVAQVTESLAPEGVSFRTVRGSPVAVVRGEVLPVRYLREVVGLPRWDGGGNGGEILIVETGGKRVGVVVDSLVGQQEVVVKQFDPPREGAALFSGATILGNGELALIVDVGSVI